MLILFLLYKFYTRKINLITICYSEESMLHIFKILILSLTILSLTAYANNKCPANKTVKVAVVQAGDFPDFIKVFRQMSINLIADGLINIETKIDNNFVFSKENSWKAMSIASKGGCIEFLEDGLYDGKWDNERNIKIKKDLSQRIKEQKDVDMIWAFGTRAGLAFADSSLNIPVLVITATSPDASGIVEFGEFSSKTNIHAQKEINRHSSEIIMFYDIFKFKTLGVLIDLHEEYQLSQSYNVIKDLKDKLGFELEVCIGDLFNEDTLIAQSEFNRCIKELSTKSDAVYITVGSGANYDKYYEQIKPLIDNQIPTFAQAGSHEVEKGALLSLSEDDMVSSGIFEANVVKEILNGKKPHEISQYYYAPLSLAINMQTARLIGWNPPFEILIAVDKVFLNIQK